MTKFLEKNKNIIENILIFLGFTLFTALIATLARSTNYDLMWCFHISQKVSKGYLLYSEISTVVSPIYFWIGGLFIKIFGNAVITMHIYSGVVQGMIATIIYNILKITTEKKANVFFPTLIIIMLLFSASLSVTSYNSLAIVFWLMAAYFEIKREVKNCENDKENIFYNIMIGFFLGLTFFTKQNYGFFAVMATGVISLYKFFVMKENTLKEILSKMLGFFIVMLGMLSYFIITNTFGDYISFCFLALLEFGKENISFFIPKQYGFSLSLILLSFMIWKEKKDFVLLVEMIIQFSMFRNNISAFK